MVVLITGGSRSGKSRFARELAEGFSCRRVFVATCPPVDEEMRRRIRSHQRERVDQMWETVEEELDLQGVLRAQPSQDLILVDCLTLWVNNLMYHAEQEGREFGEDDIVSSCVGVLDAAWERESPVIFVTNEVGMGVVPEHVLARRFRDLAGRCNQEVAARADRVVLMVSGLPMEVKSDGIA